MEDVVVRRRPGRRRAHDPQQLVVTTIAEHAESLLRVARRYSACQADAEDGYQRALEIFVKQAHRLDPGRAHKWLHTVVKHECLAVREQRARYVGVDEETLEALDDGRWAASVEDRSERFDELTRAAEALRRLKPQEATALVLKAQGLSYNEIADQEGWTYTKVNRCITEGRRAFLARFEGLRSGAECERWLPVLAAIADGEATAEQLVDARPHLRNCSGCRAALAGMQRSGAHVAALVPPVFAAGAGVGGGLLDRLGELLVGAQERVVAPVLKAQGALEAASGAKLAAVAASTVAIAGGGVAVERHASAGDGGARGAAAVNSASAEAPASVAATTPVATTTPAATTPASAGRAAAPAPAPRGRGAAPRKATEPRRARPAADVREGAEFAAESPAPSRPAAAPATEFDQARPAAPAPAPSARAGAASSGSTAAPARPRPARDEFGGGTAGGAAEFDLAGG